MSFRQGLIAVLFTASTLLVPSLANAQTADPTTAGTGSAIGISAALAQLPSLSPVDVKSLSTAEVYAAKTRVSHDQFMKQIGATEPGSGSDSAVSAAAIPCIFASDGDDVHTSVYSGVNYASGHGWWLNGTCPSSWRADVTVWLEEKLGGSWYPQGSTTGTNKAPGSGSVNRVTGKTACLNFNSYKWRSVIVVDLVGHPEYIPAAYTPIWTLACY